ncbi:hypothetical protein [Lactobacillus gasseri]|jgi:hypothetical protein|uniref:hypothetical protein n=1 Tax=Lactobacillus gasseri TaxID=1596 RepID=UPI0038A3AA46
MIEVQEELFDRLYFFAQNELGFDTYDSLPRDGTKYPFVEVAETNLVSNDLKNAYSGTITQTLNVWGDQDMRFLVAQIMNKLCVNRVKSDHCIFDLKNMQKRILPDSSVPNTRLFHGILTLEFVYTKGKF